MTDLRQADAVPKFRTPRPECHWQTASDGALVMVWSLAEAAPPALRLVDGNPDAGRAVSTQTTRAVRRARHMGERVAIALLLGVAGYLTLISFVSDYANFP